MKYLATITLAIATTITATQANWFTQLFESDGERFLREREEQRKEEQSLAEFQEWAGRNRQIRLNAARRLYGDGNPEHLEALSEQLDPAYLNAYRDAYYPNR